MLSLALSLGLLTALANLLGSALAVLQRKPSRRFTAAALGLSGGFVLAAALLEMLPESLSRGPAMPGFVAVGYLLLFLIEQFTNVHLHNLPDDEHPLRVPLAAGFASLIAFNVHDLIDGLAIGAGMIAKPELGILVFLSVLLHEIPAGFVIAAIMRSAGWSRWAAMAAGGSLGLVTIVGIFLPFWAWELKPFFADVLLAFAAGNFIYVGATLLVPLSESGKSRWITLLVVLGFAIFYGSSRLVKSLFNSFRILIVETKGALHVCEIIMRSDGFDLDGWLVRCRRGRLLKQPLNSKTRMARRSAWRRFGKSRAESRSTLMSRDLLRACMRFMFTRWANAKARRLPAPLAISIQRKGNTDIRVPKARTPEICPICWLPRMAPAALRFSPMR